MKHCPECGEKLPRQMPKHCLECGVALSSESDAAPMQKKQKANAQKAPKQSGKAVSAGLSQYISAKPLILALVLFAACAMLGIAGLLNVLIGVGMQQEMKTKKSQLDAGMNETLQMQKEDLERVQIAEDAARKAEVQSALARYVSAFEYEASQMTDAGNIYNESEKITDKNLARKAGAAKKLALLANEFFSTVDGMVDYMHDNNADMQKYSGGKAASEEAVREEFDKRKAGLKELEGTVALELETFAGTNRMRLIVVEDAINALRESERLP